MAYITKRRKAQNKIYYYLAQSVKINGMSHQKIIRSLGTSEDIEKTYALAETKGAATEAAIHKPEYCKIFQFGAVAALYDLLRRLSIVNIIDGHVKKRKQGLSIGSYMALAAINRAVNATSKADFFSWFQETVLTGLFPDATATTLSSQAFWNHMVEIDENAIENIENEVAKKIVDTYNISIKTMLYDHTNFFTFIDTSNLAKIPQRGHSKEKRTDLKIVGLTLMVSSDFEIPLFHDTYEGNKNDSRQFSDTLDKLKKRYAYLLDGKEPDITLVFDKGNNSPENIKKLISEDTAKINFVGSLRYNQCPELHEIPIENYSELNSNNLAGIKAYRTKKEIYGDSYTVIMTDNPELRNAQLDGVEANIKKCLLGLKELQDSLVRSNIDKRKRGRKYTTESVGKRVKAILSAEHMKNIFTFSTHSSTDGCIKFEFSLDSNKVEHLKQYKLGKSIIFTSRDEWSTEEIISAYRAQFHVEENFKRMKDTKRLTFRPIRHFTDRTIRVHAFYCVLSLMVCSVLRLEFSRLGYNMSMKEIFKQLETAKLSIDFYKPDKNGESAYQTVFTIPTEAASNYINEFGLKQYSITA
jgi:transposase